MSVEQSIVKYKEATEIDDQYDNAYHNWGNALATMYKISKNEDFLESAIEKFEKLLEIDPKSGDSHYGIACVRSLQGQKENMLIALEKAINLDSKYKSMALEDDDFSAYKKDAKFLELVKPPKNGKGTKGKRKIESV